jgi:signal peptidase I
MQNKFFDIILQKTEDFLSWRKRRKLRIREKQRQKNQIVDWVEAFLSAVIIVFFINQYLFQAYQIPSASMEDTLKISDRIFVDKLTYGPELLPGVVKFPGFRNVKRSDIIIFESPDYISKGPVYDIVTRIVYMMTFSFVNLDKDASGKELVHFLVKRAIGMSGDRIRDIKGNMEIMPDGSSVWIPEEKLKKDLGIKYNNHRFYEQYQYDAFEKVARWFIYSDKGLPIDPGTDQAFSQYFLVAKTPDGKTEYEQKDNFDTYYFDKMKNEALCEIFPNEYIYKKEFLKRDLGRYIPQSFVFPMGDNRDNSKDGRSFGPIQIKKVLGKSLFRFWPFDRFGGI